MSIVYPFSLFAHCPLLTSTSWQSFNRRILSILCSTWGQRGQNFTNLFGLCQIEKTFFGEQQMRDGNSLLMWFFSNVQVYGSFGVVTLAPFNRSRREVVVTKCNLLLNLAPAIPPLAHTVNYCLQTVLEWGILRWHFRERFTLFLQNCLFFKENL